MRVISEDQWISITEMDRRNKLDQQAWAAVKEFVSALDWPLFKQQYQWLCDQEASASALIPDSPEHYQALTPGFQESLAMAEGLINFLDNFKDLAVGFFDVTEEQAFSFTKEE